MGKVCKIFDITKLKRKTQLGTLQRRREEDYPYSKHQCFLKTKFPLFNQKKSWEICVFPKPNSTNFIATFSTLEISKNKNTPKQDAARDGRKEKCGGVEELTALSTSPRGTFRCSFLPCATTDCFLSGY